MRKLYRRGMLHTRKTNEVHPFPVPKRHAPRDSSALGKNARRKEIKRKVVSGERGNRTRSFPSSSLLFPALMWAC